MAAIDTLILSENVELYKIKGECSNCNYMEYRTSKKVHLEDMNNQMQHFAKYEYPGVYNEEKPFPVA